MAKFAQVRYGRDGKGPESAPNKTYTYVVNDNVRSGDNIQPVVSHANKYGPTGKVFVTTGLVINASKTMQGTDKESKYLPEKIKNINASAKTSAGYKGILAVDKDGNVIETPSDNGVTLKRVYSGKELGVDVSKVPKPGQESYQSEYNQLTRGGNMARYMQETGSHETMTKHAQETFESYSKKYME